LVYDSKGGTGIYGKASQITINGSEIHGNGGRGIEVVENSTLEIKDSKVYENGKEGQNYPQIWVENSKAEIVNSLVYDSKGGTGIYGTASQIMINGSEIHGNEGRGIKVVENSTLKIKDSRVYENGTKGQSYSQIYIENSEADISTSLVYNSIDGTGIYGIASQITITNSEVYGHYSNGIYISDSTLVMEGSQVYKNGYDVSQIDIYGKSEVKIKNSMIYEAKKGGDPFCSQYGIYISNSASKVELENVKTWGNDSGLKCNQYGTSVLIKNCEFKDGTTGL